MAKLGKSFDVDTRPSKEVVVNGLTKDATVQACIFDLIDNSVDAARNGIFSSSKSIDKTVLPDDYSGYQIKLSFKGDSFKIEDNCGGISTEALKTMVLRFGKESSHAMGIGAFGVGLNRALFKLGNVSHLKTDTGKERSELILNTTEYLKNPDWNLPAESFASQKKPGTEIEITQLPGDIAQQFGDSGWVEKIRREIGRRYGRFIEKKLVILVNRVAAKNEELPLRDDGPIDGEHKFYKTGEGVSIFVQYGEHKDHRFVGEKDYDIEKNKKLTPEYGWTVLCNDRAILIADATDKTGWDGKFHSEFYGFVGRVSFVCADPSKLPWHTTKIDVDLNNPAYRMALGDMRAFAEKWRSKAGKRKKNKNVATTVIPPKPATPSKGGGAAAPKSSALPAKVTAPVKKMDHHQFREVLPQDVQETHCTDKHLAMVHECKELDLARFPYIGMALIRVIFEISVSTHLHRHGKFDELRQSALDKRKAEGRPVAAKDEKAYLPKMEEILAYLDNNPNVWGAKQTSLKHSLKRMIAHGPMLNAAVHNPFQIIDKTKAFEIRNEVLPVIRHLIET